MLSLKTEDAKVFWYADLEKLVKEVYDQEIRILDLLFEVSNDSYREYTVDGEYGLLDTVGDNIIVQKWIEQGGTKFDVSNVPEFDWTDEAQLDVNHILYRLHIDGIIPEGKYIMTVWW